MTLNIKRPETYKLAKELSKLTGKSTAQVVTEALEEKLMALKKVKKEREFASILKTAERISKGILKPTKPRDIDKLLYDEKGLPKLLKNFQP